MDRVTGVEPTLEVWDEAAWYRHFEEHDDRRALAAGLAAALIIYALVALLAWGIAQLV